MMPTTTHLPGAHRGFDYATARAWIDPSDVLNQLDRCADQRTLLELCETLVEQDAVFKLLALAQFPVRDPNNAFKPTTDNPPEVVDTADAALLALLRMNRALGSPSSSANWKHTVLSMIPVLVQPEKHDDAIDGVRWPVQVLQRVLGSPTPVTTQQSAFVSGEQPLRTNDEAQPRNNKPQPRNDEPQPPASSAADTANLWIVDMLKAEEENDEGDAVVREMIQAPWQGPLQAAQTSCLVDIPVGRELESWTDTTLAGIACTRLAVWPDKQVAPRVLVVGLQGGALVSFLRHHQATSLLDLHVLEPCVGISEAAVEYFGLDITTITLHTQLVPTPANHFDIIITTKPLDEVGCRALVGIHLSQHALALFVCTTCSSLLCHDQETLKRCCDGADETTATCASRTTTTTCADVTVTSDHATTTTYGELQLREMVGNTQDEPLVLTLHRSSSTPAWEGTVEDWEAKMGIQSSGAMDVSAAQHTDIVRIPCVLSASEIEQIHDAAHQVVTHHPEAREVRQTGDETGDFWYVVYLQYKGLFETLLPGIKRKVLESMRQVDQQQRWGMFDESTCNIRVAEYHSMGKGGSLSDPRHYDLDSRITLDINLTQQDEDYRGGHLCGLDLHGELQACEHFNRGDAMAFVSHRFHCVQPVTLGKRHVLVVELWNGPERRCPHRCEARIAPCPDDDGDEQAGGGDNVGNTPITQMLLPFRLGAVEMQDNIARVLWQPNLETQEDEDTDNNSGEEKSAPGFESSVPKSDAIWGLFD